MVLVANNDQLIFLDKNTDGITDGSPNIMINEVQSKCDDFIGNANYDIGHIFSVGGDGLAGLGVVCRTGQKGRGVTGRGSPVGDPYDIDFVAHEMGHQFGATHTFNNSCNSNRSSATAIEPGSASTIMGYAGICSPNVQGQSDDYFHAVSIAQMWDILQTTGNCATITNTNNAAPTANAGLDYSIPKSTPFKLTGTATDANGTNSLTYNWEQLDAEIASMPPFASNSGGPMFRSLPSKTTPIRYMPDLTTVLAGNGSTGSTWERIPSVARDLNFSFLVRDNHSGGAGLARDDMKVTIVDATPFSVTSQNSFVIWDTGTTQTITWDKGITDGASINCKNVNIKLSIDGGLTFPFTLKSNTPNDGTENIVVTNNPTRSARIMVEAADNIFYNINTTNFEIVSTVPTFVITDVNGTQAACNSGNQSASYTLNLDFVNGYSQTVSFSTTGQPSGSTVSFSPTSLNADGNVVMTVSNLNGVPLQDYTINVLASSTSVNQNIDVTLKMVTSNIGAVTLTNPINNSVSVALSEVLTWNADANASSYDVQIATDSNFTNLVSSGNVVSNSYISTNLSNNTMYYWRVKAKNNCGEGSFSSAFSFSTVTCKACDSFGDTSYETSTTLVNFNIINNASGKPSGYSDYTAISTIVKTNESYNLSVNVNTDGNHRVQTKVWIDWNQNCSFDDAGEEYDLGETQNTSNGETNLSPLSIAVPTDAKLGNTIMRVSSRYTEPNTISYPTACMTNFDGEVEDYTITVESATASIDDASFSNFNLFPNPTKGTFKLQFEVVGSQKVSVQLYDITGRFIGEKSYKNIGSYFSENIIFDNLSAGLYLVKVFNGTKQTTRKLIVE